MAKADAVETQDGRLSARLAATLGPRLQDALDHPVRRELLRALHRSERPRSIGEMAVALPPFGSRRLNYHLQVLCRAETVVLERNCAAPGGAHAHYASGVCNDGRVLSVLRATERWDRERREAEAGARSSQLLTMFRGPRPTRTIRLGRGKLGGGRDS
jgi:hypothetical protein